ncbi:MAG: lipopolysaccharide biosynthesis protein [Candidatus Dormibacteria bacterium]
MAPQIPRGAVYRVRHPKWALERLYADTLARSSGYILLTTLVTAVLGFGYWVIAARAYPSPSVGTAAVSVSVMTLASLLSGLGTTAAPVQRIPERRRGREWNVTVTVGVVVGGLAGLVAGMISWAVMISIYPGEGLRSPHYALALVAGVALTNCSMVLDSVWVVERSAQIRLLTNTALSVVKLPLLLLPLLHAGGAVGIQFGWTAGVAVAVLLSLVLLARKRHYRLAIRGFWAEARTMRRSLTGNFIVNVGTNVPTYAVPVVVGAVVTASNTAYFYSAWRVGSLFFVGTAAVTTALFAEGSRDPRAAIRKAERAMLVVIPILLLATGMLALLGPATLVAFGSEYRQHGFPLLLFLIGATIPDALTAVYRTVLRLQGRYFQASCFMWGLAVLQIGLTALLLPIWGITGAGAAWFFAESVGVVYSAIDRLWVRYHPRSSGGKASGANG